MNFLYLLKTLKIIFFYKISNTKRYSELIQIPLKNKVKNIMEIGVYTARRSVELIESSKIFNKNIFYYGFDMFEDISDTEIKKELSKKPNSLLNISKKLSRINKKNYLIKGNTMSTLKKININQKFDLIFIDGGHRIKTIENDWVYSIKLLANKGIIVLDDYYVGDKNIIKKFGCNQLIEKINKKYLITFSNYTDYFDGKKYGIKLVFVRKKNDHN